MLQPPEKTKRNETWLKNWKPRVKRHVDWEAVLEARGTKVGSVVGGAAVPRPKDESEDIQGQHEDHEPEFLTIGLIGRSFPLRSIANSDKKFQVNPMSVNPHY
jgi:hypothetical protein